MKSGFPLSYKVKGTNEEFVVMATYAFLNVV